jgi:hypothetical protein
MINVQSKSRRENKNTFFVEQFFLENGTVYEMM